MPSRRALLGTIGIATATSLAGCSWGQADADGLDLTVFNQTATPFTVEIEFIADGDDGATSRHDASLDVDPNGEVNRENVVEAGAYLVRYQVYEENSTLTDEDHVHVVASGDGSDSLTFDIRNPGVLNRR